METVKTPSFGEPQHSLHHDYSGNIQAGDAIKQPSSSLKEKLGNLSSVQPQHTIFKVHNELRNIKCKTYEPNIVAIGPYHIDKDHLKKMEIHKLRYLNSFLQQESKSIEDCVSIIQEREPEARRCYAEAITLDPNQFIDMLVLDGCFIIEVTLRCKYKTRRERYDPIFSMPWMLNCVKRDLMLFENQIPLFVVSELYHLIEGRNKYIDLSTLLLYSFANLGEGHLKMPANTKHLLELIHTRLIHTYEDLEEEENLKQMFQFLGRRKHRRRRQDAISSVTRLAKSNVNFEWFDAQSMFQIGFENGFMRMPRLVVDDNTESRLRNLIAYEQYFHGGEKCYVTDFAKLMDSLINSTEDVKLLVKCGIIENWLGSEEDVTDMFNKLTEGVCIDNDNSIYGWHIENVVEHCNRRRNAWMAKLKQNHLSSPWAIISIVAASILLILTFVQTVFSIIK